MRVVALISFVTEMPAKLKNAMLTMVPVRQSHLHFRATTSSVHGRQHTLWIFQIKTIIVRV